MKKVMMILGFFDLVMLVFLTVMAIKAAAAYVNAPEGLNVRASRSTDAEVLEILPFGTEVQGKVKGQWMRLEGRKAFVSTEYLQDTNPFDEMSYQGEWRITAYAYTGSPCANGQYPTTGYTIAHNSLPFGAEVYIEGVGFRTVEDRGPAWLGSEWCDLYMGDYTACVNWGNQYRKVWVVE